MNEINILIIIFLDMLISSSPIMGEKSSLIPGPPIADLLIILRIGYNIGSVNAYRSRIKPPSWCIGNHDNITLINIAQYKKFEKIVTVVIKVGIKPFIKTPL
jgi:hypothetical protein